MSTKQKRFILPEDEIPKYWYNIQADMKTKPMPPLNPKTKEALKPEDLYPIFAKELCKQELNQTDAWIEIPEAVREMYKYYRSTPLVRAYGLEKALGTPAHIYFKNESVSPIGSHKLNSALAQAYYCKEEGVTNVTTETGAGQWGAALSYAAKVFGLEAAVYQVKISYNQKPYRRSIMQTFGATVTASPSMSTRAGKDIITRNPNYQGSLGTAISEAIELAMSTPNCKYTLGSVLSHVTLHQTVIGLEAEKQMEMAGEYPDMIIGCFGGGSNFGGICFPFMRHTILNGKQTRYIAAEPASCPKLTRGQVSAPSAPTNCRLWPILLKEGVCRKWYSGLEAAVYQVKISYQKPYRRSIMQTFGATVTASPSMSTRSSMTLATKTGYMAPDMIIGYRSGSRKANGNGRRISRHDYRLLWWRFQFWRNLLPLYAPHYPEWETNPIHCCRTGFVPETDPW